LYEAAARANGPVRLIAGLRRGGASALLASAFLLPLAACAAQPVATGSTSQAVAQPAAPAPAATAARQQDGGAMAQGRQDSGAAAPPQAPAPAAQTTTPAASPAATSNTPVHERATTVGEVPTVAATTPTPTPGVATMPGAPAAIPAAVPGGPPANPVTIPQAPGPSTGSLLQTILALVLVLALLAGLAWAAKRYGPRVAGNSANLRMVGALNIGGRERIMVVEVGDQWIVVGASPGRVNALATMPKGDAPASATLAAHTPSASNFSDWLKQTIDKRNAK
jgi:flagellar protein FliO/FliZ